MVPPDSCRISPVPHYSGYSSTNSSFTYGPFTLCGAAFQAASIHLRRSCDKSYYPRACKHALVWAVSRSLATTWEITVVFFSFRYLDVSVPGVRLPPIARGDIPTTSLPGWVAPFGHPRINASLQLPAAFRSLARPSSPLYAKASTVCPSVALSCMACTTRMGRPPQQSIAFELDLPRSKIAVYRRRTTVHTFSFLFYYPHYVKELTSIHPEVNPASKISREPDPGASPACP